MNKTILKLTSLVASLAITAACLPMAVGASATKGTNLIGANDPGFEGRTVSDTKLNNAPFGSQDKNWISRGNAYVDNTHVHSGEKSIKISDKDSSGTRAVVTGLTPGSKYWVSVWVYTTQGGKTMKLGLQGANGTTTGYTASIPCTVNGWTQICGVVTAPAGGNAAVAGTHSDLTNAWALFLTKEQTMSDHWIDDFEICAITSDSTTVINVSDNLMGENAGFESGNNSGWRTDSPKYSVINSSVDAYSGSYAAYTTRRTANYATPQMFIEDAALSDDTYYYARAMVRQGSSSLSSVKAKMILQKTEGNTTNAVPSDSSATEINEDTYTKVASIIKNIDATQAKVFVQTDESAITEGSLVNLWTDDYVLLPITSSVANGATGITPNSDITLTVPEDITADTTTLTINNGATVTGVDRTGRTCVVHLSGMAYDTEYTLKLDSSLNMDPTWEFKTASNNLLAVYDPGFENGLNTDSNTANYWTLSGGSTMNQRSTARAHTGSYSVSSTGRTEQYHGPRVTNITLGANKKYYASAWVYTAASGEKAKIRLQNTNIAAPGFTSLTAGEWTQVSAVMTVNSDSDVTAQFYVQTEGTSDIYIDDCELYEASNVTVSSSLNGETSADVDSDLTLVFSDEVMLTADNLTIDNDAAIVGVQTTDNITYTVDLGRLNNSTTYTVKVEGVLDKDFKRVGDAQIVFTTVSSTPGVVQNLLTAYDPGFENGEINTANWNKSGTVERTTEKAHDGSYSAKSSTRNTWSGPQAKVRGLQEGSQYYLSAWVYTDQAEQTAKMTLQGSSSVSTQSIDLVSGEWNHVSGIIAAPASGDSVVTDGYRLYVNTGERTDDVYIDDLEIIPYAPTVLVVSTHTDGAVAANVSKTISLTFTNNLAEGQSFDGKFTVSGRTVQSAVLEADKKTVTLTLNTVLDEYSQYTLTASGLTDAFQNTVQDISITFTTGSAVILSQNVEFLRSEAPLLALTPGEITVKAEVTNNGEESCAKPVMIITVYDENGFLIDVAATEFGETLEAEHEADDGELLKTITVDARAKSVSVHIWKAANNISYMVSPAVLSAAE